MTGLPLITPKGKGNPPVLAKFLMDYFARGEEEKYITGFR